MRKSFTVGILLIVVAAIVVGQLPPGIPRDETLILPFLLLFQSLGTGVCGQAGEHRIVVCINL